MFFGAVFLVLVGFTYGVSMERMRRSDSQLRARALALRSATEGLVHNFLPAPVVTAVNKQSADGVVDIVAWSFDPACLLQSDIVGFTALGSRTTPEDLCGCGLPLTDICIMHCLPLPFLRLIAFDCGCSVGSLGSLSEAPYD